MPTGSFSTPYSSNDISDILANDAIYENSLYSGEQKFVHPYNKTKQKNKTKVMILIFF